MSTIPFRVDDGSHRTELEIGRNISFPFSDKGDNDSFEVVIKYSQDKEYFRKLAPMSRISTPLGAAYLVDHGQCWDQGNGLYEFERTFASIPKTRQEGGTVSFTQQWWRALTGAPPEGKYFYTVDYDVEEQQFTVTGEIEFEYFTTKPDPIVRPRVYMLFEKLKFYGNTTQDTGNRIPVEDSEVGIYKGGIFYRKTSYVKLK